MESSLLSKIQTSMEVDSIYNLFTDYLHPFTPYLNSNTSSSSKTTKTLDTTTVRSLAKQFLPFLNKCLSILPKRLSSEAASKTESSTKLPQNSARKLFEIYRLCIGCLELISSQLSCKPYSVQFQWARFIHCLEAWKFFEEAEAEGLLVLERIRVCGSFGAKAASKSNTRLKLLPSLCEENVDRELSLLVVEMVVTLVKCVFMNQSNGTASYKRVLSLVEEAAPWFKILDAKECEKLQRMLVSYLDRISLYLFGQSAVFGLDLVHKFCEATFSEYARLSFGDQMYKFATRICSSIFSAVDTQSSSTTHILRCTLSYAAVGCKDLGADEYAIEFLELVYYCANRCYSAAPALCYSVAAELSSLASSQARPIVGCILQLYATGLVILSFNNQHNFGKNAKMHSDNTAGSVLFLEKKNVLQEVSISLELLKGFFDNDGSGGTAYMPSYYNGLKFLCHQLAEHIYAEKKMILGERDGDSLSDNLSISQDACLQLCYLVLQCHSAAGQNNELKNNISEDIKVIARSAVAAFTISIRTGRYMKESVNLVKRLISDDWVQVNGVKYLFAWLYNIALLLYKDKKVKEASKALSLSCKASWKCLVCFCYSTEPDGDQSSDAFQDFVKEVMQLLTEACGKTAFLLDLLYDGSREKINRIMKESLERWSIAESMCKLLPPPFSLVKHWVKVECKDVKDVNTDESTTTLYTLLSSSTVVSQRALGILLEQELLVYKAARVVDPGYCQKMRILIMNTLLERVYVTNDSLVKKARTLIAKGGEYRALGVERLDDCIHYLSEAICTLHGNSLGSSSFVIEASHVMAYALCLRALCLHESIQSNTKMLLERDFEDIRSAVNLWLKPHQEHSDAQSNLVIDIFLSSLHGTDQLTRSSDDILRLLCHVLDLLSTKCYMEVHLDIYELLIRLFKWKKLPLEDALVVFWQNRRLGHALCASPISEIIISKLSEHYGDISKSIRFWLDCLKPSKSLLVDFQLSMLSMLTVSMERSHFGQTHQSDDAKDSDMLTPSDLVCHVSADEFKLGASDLSISDPDSSISVFQCAYLCYDLSDKFVAKGQVVEALSYAKEAHRMRTKLFQDKFIFSVDQQQTKNFTESANASQNHFYSLGTFHIRDQVAMEAWGIEVQSDFKGSTLTPWIVLQCYLDSTLQVGLIHEVLGNASEAEALLYWGKSIALRQGLPIYLISFSLALGKLYEKLMVWESAEKELKAASQILGENCNMISCLKCQTLLEVSIHLQLGNLIKNRPCSCPGNTQSETLSCAGKSYLSAAKKLNISEWEWQISGFGRDGVGQAVYEVQSKTFDCRTEQFNSEAIEGEIGKKEAKVDRRKHRKTKTDQASSSNDLVSGYHLRTTRSMSRSLKNHCKATANGVQSKHKVNTNDPQPVAMGEDASDNGSLANSVLEIRSICTNMKCWHCLGLQVSKSLSLIDLVRMKWELMRKRLLLMLLISIGECLDVGNDNHKAHETILLSISVLTTPFCPSFSSLSPDSWTDFLEKENMQDLLAVECAMLLYHICRISLKDYSCKFARESSCRLSCIGIAKIFSWLKLAFTLSVEVPLLLQKVSRLLAVLYVLSTSIKDFSLSRAEALSESHWASFFHQASIGPCMKQQQFNCLVRERKSRMTDFMVSQTPGSKFIAPERCSSLGVLHELVKDLDDVVIRFFKRLPCSTIIGVSMIGGSDAILLTKLLGCVSAQAWILLSRMHSGGQPVCLLLPVGCILEESSVEMVTSSSESCESKDLVKSWKCPWSCSVVDNVAPIFKVLLKENYLSSSIYPAEDTEQSRLLWWSERKRLDKCIAKFLKDLEDLWLGPWKYLLLGEWANNESLHALEKDIMADLRLKYKVDVDMNLVRVIVSSVQFSSELREQALQLIFSKGCYVGGCCEEILSSSAKCRNLSADFFSEIVEAIQGLEIESFVRQPVVLVLDVEIQMLPWESLPIFRNEEVYRMPCIDSIFATLDKCSHNEEMFSLRAAAEGFPFIDPLDSFYLLNPSGDLSRTQEEFEDYFKHQNFEGKSGSSPTIEELVAALKSHDLFIYFGHGSGSQYIPGHEIRKLETCAATLLMGCSSGTLSTKGMYAPEGAPLSYLSAGSPVIVANLWEVTDKDIDRFGKAVLDAWLKQRSSSLVSADCPECSSSSSSFLLDKLRSLEVSDDNNKTRRNHNRSKGKKKSSTDDKLQKNASSSSSSSDVKICVPCCKHRPKVGAFMGQARKACLLPYLIGASPVCYGVPTGIWKKKDL